MRTGAVTASCLSGLGTAMSLQVAALLRLRSTAPTTVTPIRSGIEKPAPTARS